MDSKSIFLVFEDIIKTPSLAILKALLEPGMKKNFSEVIDYTRFEFMNEDNLLRLCIQRSDKNILRYLGLSETFDYDKMYETMYNTIDDKYNPYPSLKMVEVMALSISMPQISTLYVYSEKFDPEIQTQLGLLFNANSGKIKYVYGEIQSVIKDKNISLFILPDVETIDKLYDLKCLHGKEVLIANYGYNYTLDPEGNLVFKFDIEKTIEHATFYKLRAFSPFDLEERHMSQILNNIEENNNLSLG